MSDRVDAHQREPLAKCGRGLIVHQASQHVTVQDLGRPGYLVHGLSRGGAADRMALAEGAALLGQDACCAALELAGQGGVFEATQDMRIAFTGAPMRAALADGTALAWNASHLLPAGLRLTLGAMRSGSYGYLHVAGGVATPKVLGARSAHMASGLGHDPLQGTVLPVAADAGNGLVGMTLAPQPRFDGGELRMVASLQTEMFAPSELQRFQEEEFIRDTRANRMGVRLCPQGVGFALEGGLSVVSEVIAPGDIQVTGDGAPYVLMSECQTTGGYPRIGSVLPCDMARVAQAPAGARFRFRLVTLNDAVKIEAHARQIRARLASSLQPLLRDPAELRDLLSYQLISGATAGDDLEQPRYN